MENDNSNNINNSNNNTHNNDTYVVLYKWPSSSSSSLSTTTITKELSFDLECLRCETYIRLAEVPFECESCQTPSSSPSSVLPCLEVGYGEDTIVGGSGDEIKNDSKVATYRILHHLKNERNIDLNRTLSQTEKARDVCLSAIANGLLKEACDYFTWTHEKTFIERTRTLYGAKYPFPLNRIVPNKMREKRGVSTCDEIKARVLANEAFEVIETMLSDNNESDVFALGKKKPTNCDADLFAVLYYVVSSSFTEELRSELKSFTKVIKYVEAVKRRVLAHKPLNANDDEANAGVERKIDPTTWRDGARRNKQQGWTAKETKKKLTPEERRMRRHAVYSVLFAISSVVAFIMFSPGMTLMVEMDDVAGEREEEEKRNDDDVVVVENENKN